jgi:hypothetical protein
MDEARIDSLLREWNSGNGVRWSREDYVRWIRQGLLEYGALCDVHGDQVRARQARKAVETLDMRFNLDA